MFHILNIRLNLTYWIQNNEIYLDPTKHTDTECA